MPNTNAFDTAALRLFHEVAGSGSFTAAAELLGYTQSAVSRRIAALERAAGGPLFERLPRGVRLTSAGHLLHRHAAEVLDRLDQAGEELIALHRGSGGTLRVGSFATANADLLPTTLKRFAERRPAIDLRLIEGLSPHLIERLHAGALDMAVISDYLTTPPGELRLIPLLADRLLVALPRDHALAGEDEVDLRDLAQESWIEAAPRGQPTLLLAACSAAGFTPRGGLRVAEWSGKFGFVAAGLGVTLVPELAARAVPPSIVLRRLRGRMPARTVYAVLPEPALPAATELAGMLGEWEACTTATRT
ncbi:LysR family transcriptional regulator [Nonomuraea sp. NPDC048826]|uniref:LysR family transcriptional regulator n=1 Tax=Nonomuraea sp. NPDC048826 TaxID=3364347 RepID=UPI00371CE443